LYPLNHRAVKTVRRLQLLTHIRRNVSQPDSPAGFPWPASEVSFPDLSRLAHSFESDRCVMFLPSRISCR
jgi:hypothetical protein